jgi:hypothetical protein
MIMKDETYLDLLRSRPCSFCAYPKTEPHHSLRRLRGISEGGLAQKGPDYLAIPICHRCHEHIRDGRLKPSREEYMELCLINLICYLSIHHEQLAQQSFNFMEKHKPKPNQVDYAALGRLGGQVRSEKKTLAVRKNGCRGGRPRKNQSTNQSAKIQMKANKNIQLQFGARSIV